MAALALAEGGISISRGEPGLEGGSRSECPFWGETSDAFLLVFALGAIVVIKIVCFRRAVDPTRHDIDD